MKQKKYICREGAAAYGQEGIFRVSSVTVITPVLDLTSKRRREERKPRRQQDFSQILAEKTKQQEESRCTEGTAYGYTRTGQLCISQPAQRTYC